MRWCGVGGFGFHIPELGGLPVRLVQAGAYSIADMRTNGSKCIFHKPLLGLFHG
jgi:hypothetical protein